MPLPCREETVTRSDNTYSSRKRESQIALPQTQSAFHRRAQRNASRRRDARQQSDRSPVGINRMASSQRVMFSGAKHAQSSITTPRKQFIRLQVNGRMLIGCMQVRGLLTFRIGRVPL
jgi:hypothetical protein